MLGGFAVKDTMTPMACNSKASARGDDDPTTATGTSTTVEGVADEEMMSDCSSTTSHAIEERACSSTTIATDKSTTEVGVANEDTMSDCSSTTSHANEERACDSAMTASHASSIVKERLSKATWVTKNLMKSSSSADSDLCFLAKSKW
jgi:hypothetical protein